MKHLMGVHNTNESDMRILKVFLIYFGSARFF